jgi:hypothetical protein
VDCEWQWWLEGRQQITQKRKNSDTKRQKIEWRVTCRTNEDDEGNQKKEGNRGFQMIQQLRELVKKWVRYKQNKSENSGD